MQLGTEAADPRVEVIDHAPELSERVELAVRYARLGGLEGDGRRRFPADQLGERAGLERELFR